MSKLQSFIFCSFISFATFSQEISGEIYDNNNKPVTISVMISNNTLGLTTYSNDEGNFRITANKNDSISFTSSFYIKKVIRVDSAHLKENFAIHLKEKIIELDEVELREYNFSNSLNNVIKQDIINNPSLYKKQSNGNMDFMRIGEGIIKLIKKKDKKPEYISIQYADFEFLFKKNAPLFNEKLLTNDLKIPIEFKSLFFEYCESKHINAELLLTENNFLLVDELVKSSIDFKTIYNKD